MFDQDFCTNQDQDDTSKYSCIFFEQTSQLAAQIYGNKRKNKCRNTDNEDAGVDIHL